MLVGVAKALFYAKVYIRKFLGRFFYFKSKERREKLIVLLMATTQIVLLLGMLVLIIIVLTHSTLWYRLRSNGAKLMTTLSIVLTIYSIIWIPWYLCYFEVVGKKKET